MRIVIDARESGSSTGRYVDKLIENMHGLKPAYEIVVLTKTPRMEYLKKLAPNFQILKSDYKEFTFAEQFGFLRQLYSLKPDLVHFGMTQQPVLYTGLSVTTIHDLTTIRFNNPAKNPLIFKAKQLVYKIVIRLVAHKSKAIFVVSKYVKKDLANYAKVNQKKIVVTYEAADKIEEPPNLVPGVKKPFMMYVGRPTPHKNLRSLMEALSLVRLKLRHPELQLVLAGREDKLYKKHRKWAEREHIENLIFTGFISEGQLRWLYENTSGYIFPSLSEGFGLPGLEAMTHGAPVISSNATCLPEIYGDAAMYFNPRHVGDMANKIAYVLDNPTVVQELRAKGFKQAGHYSWRRMAEQTLEVYKKALTK